MVPEFQLASRLAIHKSVECVCCHSTATSLCSNTVSVTALGLTDPRRIKLHRGTFPRFGHPPSTYLVKLLATSSMICSVDSLTACSQDPRRSVAARWRLERRCSSWCRRGFPLGHQSLLCRSSAKSIILQTQRLLVCPHTGPPTHSCFCQQLCCHNCQQHTNDQVSGSVLVVYDQS